MPKPPFNTPLYAISAHIIASVAPHIESLRRGGRFALGCSAGGDSMALLEIAASFASERKWKLTVAHYDHAQRPESADEAAFVAARAELRGLDFRSEKMIATPGPSEDAMRHARFDFFARVVAETESETILLAHQADDSAETLLMRLMAGSGPAGLAAIREKETINVDGRDLTILRPLLDLRRAELRSFLSVQGLDWRDDPSNDDAVAKRSWVRRDLIPRLDARMGADVAHRLARTAKLIERESRALTQAVDLLLGQIVLPAAAPALGRLHIAHPLWRQAAPELRAQLVRQWLWDLKPGPYPPRYEALQEAMKFIAKKGRGAQLHTVDSLWLVRGAGGIWAFGPETDAETRAALATHSPAQ